MNADSGRLVDRVAIVTGARRGIGLAIAQRLVAEGARVGLTARRPEALAEAVAALGGPEYALAVPGRSDDPEHRAAAVQQVSAAFGPVDLLVNRPGRVTTLMVGPGPLITACLDSAVRRGTPWG
ncbi:SDR family NAD(P)-dependent oxidoreductase [Micromonospora sp. DT201]|uniref:SDR family NAD(P)-dependent oxidoreductase n=1 Tax=Micromonospora sp. DT201 TaxID=3393442 RepID=UPI003CE7456B